MNTLTWSLLSPADTHRCLAAAASRDVCALRARLRDDVDGAPPCAGRLLRATVHSAAQVDILLDLYAHVLLFAHAQGMSADKASTLVALVHTLHERSMAERRTRASSYDVLRELVVQHSVAQPPYAAAVFDIADVQAIDVYLLTTYYRHYKMYAYAFMPRHTATLRTVATGDVWAMPMTRPTMTTTTAAVIAKPSADATTASNDSTAAASLPPTLPLLPVYVPPCATAVPQDVWRARVQERARLREDAALAAHDAASAADEAQRMRDAGLCGPHYTAGVREQLQHIRDAVAAQSLARLDAIEAKLSVVEAHVSESLHGRSTPTRSASRK